MMNKSRSVILIIFFIFIIASPFFISSILKDYLDNANYENRNAAEKPNFFTSDISEYPKKYEEYFNDTLPFRNQMIRLTNSIDVNIFRSSPNPDVTFGKDGWLFYSMSTDGDPVSQSRGCWKFTEEELQAIASNLKISSRILESFGIEYVLYIAPNKETIYLDKIPDLYPIVDEETATDQMVDYLRKNTDIRIVYPKEEILNAMQEDPELVTYHKLDTHWNNAGGYIGAKAFLGELGINVPNIKDLALEKFYLSSGDLANMLNIKVENGDIDYTVSGYTDSELEIESEDYFTDFIYHAAGKDPRRLLVRRDSFSTAMAKYVASQFENSKFTHGAVFANQDIIAYDADIFVYETVERAIRALQWERVSYINSSIEELPEGKTVSISNIFAGRSDPDVTITQVDSQGNESVLWEKQPLTEAFQLNLPSSEKRTIRVDVYDPAAPETVLETVTIWA